MYVCLCKSITDSEIIDTIETGVTSFDSLQEKLSLGRVCGSCTCEAKDILNKKLQQDLKPQPLSIRDELARPR